MEKLGTSALIRRILLVILIASLILGAGGFYLILRQRALQTAAKDARMLLTTAMSVSTFTDREVFQLLDKLPTDKFYKQTVPFFAVSAVFDRFRKQYPNYTFRQTALDPTNPADRPTPHEVELTDRFRSDASLQELQGIREVDDRSYFYLARPLKVTSESCLVCHSTPARAPAAMVAEYGSGGFGWRLGETVGVIELSVPITEELRATVEVAATLAAGLLLVFVTIYFTLTAALGAALVAPLRRLAEAADAASRSSETGVVLPRLGTRELRQLSDAIGRLTISLRKSMQQLTGRTPKSSPRNWRD